MLEAILYFVAGFLLCDLLTYLRARKVRREIEHIEDERVPSRVLIEYHSDCFFAYSGDTNWFIAQDTSLADLLLRVMKNDPSVIIAASDDFVIGELKKIVASSQESNHTAV